MKAPLAPLAAAGRERIREVVVPKAKRREVYAQNDEIAFGTKPVFATLSCPHVPLSKDSLGSTWKGIHARVPETCINKCGESSDACSACCKELRG